MVTDPSPLTSHGGSSGSGAVSATWNVPELDTLALTVRVEAVRVVVTSSQPKPTNW